MQVWIMQRLLRQVNSNYVLLRQMNSNYVLLRQMNSNYMYNYDKQNTYSNHTVHAADEESTALDIV